jgi:hypothetical protein
MYLFLSKSEHTTNTYTPPPINSAAEPNHQARGPKRGVGLAGDIVASVSKGLEALTCGHRNPVSEIVGIVSDGLKRGAGETPNRHPDKRK